MFKMRTTSAIYVLVILVAISAFTSYQLLSLSDNRRGDSPELAALDERLARFERLFPGDMTQGQIDIFRNFVAFFNTPEDLRESGDAGLFTHVVQHNTTGAAGGWLRVDTREPGDNKGEGDKK